MENTTRQLPVSLVQGMGLFDTKGGYHCAMHTGTVQRPLCTHQPGYTHLAVQRYEIWSHTTLKFQTYHVRYVVRGLCIWDVGKCNCAEFAWLCIF